MAISYKSDLHDSERLFVLSIDRYEDGLKEGVLYHGKDQEGVRFAGYLELIRIMEGLFRQMQSPRLMMDQRILGSNKEEIAWKENEREYGRRPGQTATITIRVVQRQNASWQGILKNQASGESHPFSSFLDMVCHLDEEICEETEITAEKIEDRTACQQRLERYLRMVMECDETMKILPDTLAYRFRNTGGSRTFMVRPMFYEHNTCQGTLYWKEGKKQKSFRSFLELVGMMNDVICRQNEWPDQEEAV